MRGRCRARQGGFTFVETSLTLAIVATGVIGISALIGTTNRVVNDVNVDTRARMIERRNVDSLSAILRGVPVDTLANFDGNGVSVAPQFSRSVDIVGGLPQPSPQAQLYWQADPAPVVGVASPGAVWLNENGGARLAADNVPANGFSVEQDGKRLIIRLTTYYPGRTAEETVLRNSTTVVRPRN